MRDLNISIEKGRISSFHVSLKEEKVAVNASIDLLTPNGEAITSYNISSDNWDKFKKFNLPLTMIEPIKKILYELERIVVLHCENRNKMLEGGL